MEVIGGRYQVVERLGQGAMGVVYKAYDPVLDRQVAIKKMAADIGGDPLLRQRFSQEARAAGRLNHQNIVTIHELDDRQGEICIVMEFLEGIDLATLIRRRAVLPIEARLNLIAQVCDGLDFAHRAGIVHRDIKPANLHVSPAGHVKIVDFGIARLASSQMTNTGSLIGTPDYMSPEQIMAGKIDGRSDLFAVGVVLYELLSGSKPFEAESVTAVLMKIVRDPHVPLRDRVPQLPQPLVDVVERALAKDPADRPQTAQDIREALVSCAAGERAVLDPATISAISTVVTTETLRPPSGVQPSGSAASVARSLAPSSSSDSQLASLAVEHGRSLRNSGDLAGAMRVFRSVLESSPGNNEALQELAALESAIVQITSVTGVAAPPAAAAPEPAALKSRAARKALVPALVIGCFVLGFAVVTGILISSRSRPSPAASPVSKAAEQPVPPPVSEPAPPPTTVAAPRRSPIPSAPAAPASGASPVASPAPVGAAPSAPAATPHTPTLSERSVTVKHLHGLRNPFKNRSLDLGRDSCVGVLEFVPSGFHFKTRDSADRRVEDEDLTFRNIKEFQMESDRIHIVVDRRNWDFLGSPEDLAQIERHLKSGKPAR